jgi:hypothetical protein
MTKDPIQAARSFVDHHFPDALAAIVGGSFLRGEATSTSDLDIVVVADLEDAPFRASYREFGWPIEALVHTRESYRWYFESDAKHFNASLARMCSEGVVLFNVGGLADRIKLEASQLIERGPPPLAPEELESRRYGLTDVLDDFVGCNREDEGILIAAALAAQAAHIILLQNRRWIGHGKWVLRSLRLFDSELAGRLASALTEYARAGDKQRLISFAEEALAQAGGPLFEGYYSRGRRSSETD